MAAPDEPIESLHEGPAASENADDDKIETASEHAEAVNDDRIETPSSEGRRGTKLDRESEGSSHGMGSDADFESPEPPSFRLPPDDDDDDSSWSHSPAGAPECEHCRKFKLRIEEYKKMLHNINHCLLNGVVWWKKPKPEGL